MRSPVCFNSVLATRDAFLQGFLAARKFNRCCLIPPGHAVRDQIAGKRSGLCHFCHEHSTSGLRYLPCRYVDRGVWYSLSLSRAPTQQPPFRNSMLQTRRLNATAFVPCRPSGHAVAPKRIVLPPACHALRHAVRAAVTSAAAVAPDAHLQPTTDAELAAEPIFPSPSVHHMPQLTGKERAALRAHSESLAKAKTLQRLQVGAQGITFNVLVRFTTLSSRHCHFAPAARWQAADSKVVTGPHIPSGRELHT